MATKPHSTVSVASRHPLPKYAYANAAARTGATGFVATDLNALAHQEDNDTYWILTATTPTWLQVATGGPTSGFTAASVIFASGAGALSDDGADFSYAAGIVTLANGLTFTGGGTIASTSNGNIDLIPDGTGITTTGGGTGNHSLNAPGDFYVSGKLEVDDALFADNGVNVTDDAPCNYGTGNDSAFIYSTSQTAHALVLGLSTNSKSFIISNRSSLFFDFGHPLQINPTVYFQSLNNSTTEWGSLAHDQTDFLIDSGTLTTKFTGGLKHNVTTVNVATYDLLASDYFVHVAYTTTAAVTSLTLPTAQTVAGRTIFIKDAGGNAATFNITVDCEAGQTIDGNATLDMTTDYEFLSLYSDGTNWFIKGA